MNYGARIEDASAVCNIALVLLLNLPWFTSKHDLIWTSFNFAFTPPIRYICVYISHLYCIFPFDFASKGSQINFFLGLAAPEHELTRPLVPGDINPIVVVRSRLSGMLKPLLCFQRSSSSDDSSPLYVYMRVKGVNIMYVYSMSTCLTLVAFHSAARAHSRASFLCPCGFTIMKTHISPVQRCLHAAVFASHWSSGRWDSLAGWHRLLSCHWSAAPVAPYVQTSAHTLFMLWCTL